MGPTPWIQQQIGVTDSMDSAINRSATETSLFDVVLSCPMIPDLNPIRFRSVSSDFWRDVCHLRIPKVRMGKLR